MAAVETTKMSSKGQIVIPEEIRNKMGLKTGDKFVVICDRDVVILKTISRPSLDEFEDLLKKVRKQARAAGVKKSDITDAIAWARKNK
jgi:AbrB family looped-hinge helix DNA binding protein